MEWTQWGERKGISSLNDSICEDTTFTTTKLLLIKPNVSSSLWHKHPPEMETHMCSPVKAILIYTWCQGVKTQTASSALSEREFSGETAVLDMAEQLVSGLTGASVNCDWPQRKQLSGEKEDVLQHSQSRAERVFLVDQGGISKRVKVELTAANIFLLKVNFALHYQVSNLRRLQWQWKTWASTFETRSLHAVYLLFYYMSDFKVEVKVKVKVTLLIPLGKLGVNFIKTFTSSTGHITGRIWEEDSYEVCWFSVFRVFLTC